MGDGDGGLNFDFEGGLDATTAGASAVVVAPASGEPSSDAPGPAADGKPLGQGRGRGSFRQTVCRHWLRGLCMKGGSCGFLHQYDKDRMPVCRFYREHGDCREQECVFKHTDENIKECSMYNMGFCPNGPYCRYRHVKQPGPPPPVEEIFQKLQQMNIFNYGSSNRFYQHRVNNYNQQGEKPQVQHGSVPHNQNLPASATPLVQQPAAQHVQTVNPPHVPPPQQQQQQQNAQDCAKVTSRIGGGNWNMLTELHYGQNFSLQWLKAVLIAAETKEEEEKSKGVSAGKAADNQDIVLFDDNEEEGSKENNENNGEAAEGSGRGKGAKLLKEAEEERVRCGGRRPHMPMLRGAWNARIPS